MTYFRFSRLCVICLPGILGVAHLFAQKLDDTKALATPMIVRGQPFSAIKYSATFKNVPGGRPVLKGEIHRLMLARNDGGALVISGADQIGESCDLPGLGDLPLCSYWETSLFQPDKNTMWHWSSGSVADRTQITQMDMQPSERLEVERLTSLIGVKPFSEIHADPDMKLEDLGQRDIEGVHAKGYRITTTTRAGDGLPPKHQIHEVWYSSELHLVIAMIDGDPAGEETIAGLIRLDRSPAPSLFQPPSDRIVRHWPDSRPYVGSDLQAFKAWETK